VKYLLCSKYKQQNLVEKFIFLFFICLFIGNGSTLYGQNKPLDNWDLEVLKKKDLQSETYFSFVKREPYNDLTASTLLRYGINKNIELQVTWTGIKTETFQGNESEQSSRVGLKAYLNKDSKYLPGFSIIGSVNLTPDPKDNPLRPAVNILFRKGLAKNFALTGNYQFILDEQNGDLGADFAVNFDVVLTKWLTTYVGVKGVKSFPIPDDSALYQEYFELGMLFWVSDGFRIYPYFDLGFADGDDDTINIGILYHFN
jgi:hypothetical protein